MDVEPCCLEEGCGGIMRVAPLAVNHSGDSDSTGAVTGNILGALLGYDAIAEQWKKDLELSDVILEVADDLCRGCQMSEHSSYEDPEWTEKYIHGRKKKRREKTNDGTAHDRYQYPRSLRSAAGRDLLSLRHPGQHLLGRSHRL